MSLPTEAEIQKTLERVVDPEINFNIVELGLIYAIERNEEKKHINIRMTLPSPGCPFGPQILTAVESNVKGMENVSDVTVELTFSPPWDPRTMASDDVKDTLGIF